MKILVRFSIYLSKSSIAKGLDKLGITLKRVRVELERVNSPETIIKRRVYALEFTKNSPVDKTKCIFLDECGFNLQLHRSQARSRKDMRANVTIPTIRGRNITLISAMSSAGVLHSKIIDDGTCTASKFESFVEELVEILKNRDDMKGAMILMDNAKILRPQILREKLENASLTLNFFHLTRICLILLNMSFLK